MARGEVRKAVSPPVLQFALWEVVDEDRSNMVALYDLAPRFVFVQRKEGDGPRKVVVEREFEFSQRRYRIILKPTQVRRADGREEVRHLGEREQIVEEVLRRLASNRNRLKLHGENKVRFPFTVSEVQQELSRVRHTYSKEEIREAIMLLHEVRIQIIALDDKRVSMLSAPAFPVVGMRRGIDDDTETFVEFNPLVADAIRSLGFHQVSYELLMSVRDPVSRWLLKRLHAEVSSSGEPVQQMSASDIRVNSGMPEWKKSRDMLRRIERAIELLRTGGILSDIQAEPIMSGNRKDDVVYTMVVSEWYMAQVRRSCRVASQNVADFKRLAPGRDPSGGLVPLGPAEVYRLREARRRMAAAPEQAAESIATLPRPA